MQIDSDNTPLDFPCEFPIKAMGRAGEGLDALVVEIVGRHVDNLPEGAVRVRDSRGGNYLSITVTIRATSREQLDAIYRELNACDQILMTL